MVVVVVVVVKAGEDQDDDTNAPKLSSLLFFFCVRVCVCAHYCGRRSTYTSMHTHRCSGVSVVPRVSRVGERGYYRQRRRSVSRSC